MTKYFVFILLAAAAVALPQERPQTRLVRSALSDHENSGGHHGEGDHGHGHGHVHDSFSKRDTGSSHGHHGSDGHDDDHGNGHNKGHGGGHGDHGHDSGKKS